MCTVSDEIYSSETDPDLRTRNDRSMVPPTILIDGLPSDLTRCVEAKSTSGVFLMKYTNIVRTF